VEKKEVTLEPRISDMEKRGRKGGGARWNLQMQEEIDASTKKEAVRSCNRGKDERLRVFVS